MNHKPQVAITIAQRSDGVQSWECHLGRLSIWRWIYRLCTAISQHARETMLDLEELGQQHG
jgi:hypothetical protein